MAFGGFRLTFAGLLENLRRREDCSVDLLSGLADIPDTDQSASGELWMVTRGERFALIEVYHYDLPVWPELVRSICVQLDIPPNELFARRD